MLRDEENSRHLMFYDVKSYEQLLLCDVRVLKMLKYADARVQHHLSIIISVPGRMFHIERYISPFTLLTNKRVCARLSTPNCISLILFLILAYIYIYQFQNIRKMPHDSFTISTFWWRLSMICRMWAASGVCLFVITCSEEARFPVFDDCVYSPDHVGCFLSNHDGGRVCVSSYAVWHDRCVHYTQALYTFDPVEKKYNLRVNSLFRVDYKISSKLLVGIRYEHNVRSIQNAMQNPLLLLIRPDRK